MNNIMVDLETLGTGPNSVILSIGAVEFDFETNSLGAKFYTAIDIESCMNAGLKVDPSTIKWWAWQSDEARKVFNEKSVQLEIALDQFAKFVNMKTFLWGNGSDFDNVILANAYIKTNRSLPWKFYNNRCYRTFKSIAENNFRIDLPKIQRMGTHHNAMDDAEDQANHILQIHQLIKEA